MGEVNRTPSRSRRWIDNLRMARAVAEGRFLGKRTPLSVTIEVTDRCNLDCVYCDWSHAGTTLSEMSRQEIEQIIDGFKALGTRQITFSGGEPMLREDIGALIVYSRSRGIVTAVTTNGWYVAEHVERLRDASLVVVSLDGPREIHDRLRGRGSHARAMDAIEALCARDVPVVSSTVLTRRTIDTLDWVLDEARRVGFSALFALVFHQHARGVDREVFGALLPSPGDCDSAFAHLLQRKNEGHPVFSSSPYLRYMASGMYRRCPFECKAGNMFCAVGADGQLGICGLQLGHPDLPNVVTDGVAEAFRHLEQRTCTRAYCNFGVERSMLFSLYPAAVANMLLQWLPTGGGRR